jgi:hypothetical protein
MPPMRGRRRRRLVAAERFVLPALRGCEDFTLGQMGAEMDHSQTALERAQLVDETLEVSGGDAPRGEARVELTLARDDLGAQSHGFRAHGPEDPLRRRALLGGKAELIRELERAR